MNAFWDFIAVHYQIRKYYPTSCGVKSSRCYLNRLAKKYQKGFVGFV